MQAIDEAWIRMKSRHVMAHTLLALRRLPEVPSLAIYKREPLNVPAFIVGASPCLEVNGHLLAECASRGLVFATNSSNACLEHYGATPHVIHARESIDVSDQIAASRAAVIALDVSVHPKAWDAAGERGRWYWPCYPRHYEICRRLDVCPLDAGSAAATAAIAHAVTLGCNPVVLVGLGGCLGPLEADGTGATYHPAAPRGEQRWRPTDGGQRCAMTGNERDDARHIASGQRPPGTDLSLDWIRAWDGQSAVPTISTLASLVDEVSDRAQRWARPGLRLLNCNEGGAAYPGWEPMRLEALLDEVRLVANCEHFDVSRALAGRSVTREETRSLAEYLARGTAKMRFCAEEMTRDRPLAINLVHGGILERAEIVEALGSADLLDAWTLNPNPGPKRIRAQAEAMLRTAEAGATLLAEVLG